MTLKGLIPGKQQPTHPSDKHGQFGTIKNEIKMVDPLLHYGCFTLGFDRTDIIQHVCDAMQNIKPEIAESIVHAEDLKLNHASYELSNKLFEMSGGYRSFFALSGSDANEGAIKLSSAYHHVKKNYHKTQVVSFVGSLNGLLDKLISSSKSKGLYMVLREAGRTFTYLMRSSPMPEETQIIFLPSYILFICHIRDNFFRQLFLRIPFCNDNGLWTT